MSGDRPLRQGLLDPAFMARLARLRLLSRRVFRGKVRGERRSRKKGVSSEFDDYRQYVPGDDLRFLDWNIYGRLDELVIKLFLEEEDLHVHLLVDVSESMAFGDPSKLDYAAELVAALGYISLCGLDRVAIYPFGMRAGRPFGPARGSHRLREMLEFLGGLTGEGQTNLNESLRDISLTARGRGVVVVISDFLDPDGYEEGLRRLIGARMDVQVVQVLDPGEVTPPVTGDVRVVDVETGDYTDISVSGRLMSAYHKTVVAFREGLEQFCVARGARYLFATTDTPVERLVMGQLRRARLVG